MKKVLSHQWFLGLLAFLLTYGAFFIQYPHLITHANNETFYDHGDLMVTHADMIYHVKYDDNSTFSGMNYPKGEYIFMTDANGSFATVFRWINDHVVDITEVMPGMIMHIMFLCLGLCGLFLYFIMKRLGVSTLIALALAPMITLLSPQMARFVAHLSLSYPMVLPMVILWCLRKYDHNRLQWLDLVFAAVLFFIFMNNAYVGFIMSMFCGLIGFLLFLFDYKKKNHLGGSITMMAVPVLITIAVYVILKVNDPYDDRLEVQWGFFHYHTHWKSLFAQKYSLLGNFSRDNTIYDFRSVEWANNLGIIPILLCISAVIEYAYAKLIKKSTPLIAKLDQRWIIIFVASVLMFLFAANTTIFPIKDFIEEHLTTLLMFKSSGRFSWPLYFTVALISAVILQKWVDRISANGRLSALFLVVPLVLFYAFEVNFYLDQIFGKLHSENYLTAPYLDNTPAKFEEYNINRDRYQAMIVVPLLEGWNEKIATTVDKKSERGALTVMAFTGIPMVNGRLSRNSTGMTLEATQIASNSLIEKRALANLPSDKPLLIVMGAHAESKLSPGENALKDKAKYLFTVPKFHLFEITLDQIAEIRADALRAAAGKIAIADSISSDYLYVDHFETEIRGNALFGNGSGVLKKGDNVVLDQEFEFGEETNVLFSNWTEITNKMYGSPEFRIQVLQDDKQIYKADLASRAAKDIYKNWIRSEAKIPMPQGKARILIQVDCNQDFLIDEVNLVKEGDTTIHALPDGNYLIDNYPVIIADIPKN